MCVELGVKIRPLSRILLDFLMFLYLHFSFVLHILSTLLYHSQLFCSVTGPLSRDVRDIQSEKFELKF